MPAEFCELSSDGVIRVHGTEAVPFLHAQLTSDVAGLAPLRTQYAAYCTPQGRALAAFLLWRLGDEILLELPESVRESVQTRLSKYVLRANVKVARGEYRAFGVWGSEGHAALAQLGGGRPAGIHDIVSVEGIHAAQLGPARFIVMAGAAEVARARSTLERCASEREESAWT
ncbi:MAG: YgfZ/GcvT domain-containing protein, partial [Burkholderiales bacterium]